jgi:hypothetical protein
MVLIQLIPYSYPTLRTQWWDRGVREKPPVSLMRGWQAMPLDNFGTPLNL